MDIPENPKPAVEPEPMEEEPQEQEDIVPGGSDSEEEGK